MRPLAYAGLIMATASTALPTWADQKSIVGHWTSQGDSVVVSIATCKAQADQLCAVVAKEVLEPGDTSLLGQVAVDAIAPKGPGKWSGRYTLDGANLEATLRLASPDRLTVTVCVAPLMCETSRYRRVSF